MQDKRENLTLGYRLFQLDQEYKERTNFTNYVKEAQNFYNGNHYPNDNFNNMIRVTLNFCSFSSNLKAAKIVGTQRYITYTADNTSYDCSGLARFDEYNVKKLHEQTEDFQTALDGYNNGTAIVMYRWDEDDMTYKGIYKGGLALEQIDILRFAVANPYLKELQNQKWVEYWNDCDVLAVRDMLERKLDSDREEALRWIVPDSWSDEQRERNQSVNHGLCTVYTRYFRIGGEVYFMSSTKTVDLFEYPHAMNPRVNRANEEKMRRLVDEWRKETAEGKNESLDRVHDIRIDFEDMVAQIANSEELNERAYRECKERFGLYPFAKFVPFAINNSFYGRSDIKDMIPMQKGVNFVISMALKCMENNAYNKIFAKADALDGQEITNEPGQVIFDHSRGSGFGIKMAESQPVPNGMLELVDRLIAQTRLVYGFNDVMDGSVSNEDISGYAIQQMIKQANSSIEQQQQLFWRFCQDKAEIRLMFYRFYVDQARYTYELDDYEMEGREQARQALLARQGQLRSQGQELNVGDIDLSEKTRKTQIRDFSGKELYGTSFDISIDVMQGLADSKLAESQMWDTLIMNGAINNMSPEMLEMYLEANPTVQERSKAKLRAIVEKQKRSENVQLKQQLQEAAQYMQKLIEYSKELEAENGYKTNYISNLEKEFTQKIGVANKVIQAQSQLMAGQGKSEGEQKSENARGAGSQTTQVA